MWDNRPIQRPPVVPRPPSEEIGAAMPSAQRRTGIRLRSGSGILGALTSERLPTKGPVFARTPAPGVAIHGG